MATSLTYAQAAADILAVSAAGDDPQVQLETANKCLVMQQFIQEFAERTDGYMLLAAFLVSFTEIKKVIDAATGDDRTLLESLVVAIIGSFGRSVQ